MKRVSIHTDTNKHEDLGMRVSFDNSKTNYSRIKVKYFFLMLTGLVLFALDAKSQIKIDQYYDFLSEIENLEAVELNLMYPRSSDSYYKGYNETPAFSNVLYLDSVKQKLELTEDELTLLKSNHFFVSERLSASSFYEAYTDIYNKDLPVFISTDFVLHALHLSYSQMLKYFELNLMSSNLEEYLKDLYFQVPSIISKYQGKGLDNSLRDFDLYIAVAYSLITDSEQKPRFEEFNTYANVMKAISDENVTSISLFCSSNNVREIDFSQFKPRGYYVYTEMDKVFGAKSLEPYFRTMMWLGRIDLFLTTPDTNWSRAEIQRMNIAAFLLNETNQGSSKKNLLQLNESIINSLVGESDNITMEEYNNYLSSLEINNAEDLLNDSVYDSYYQGLLKNEDFIQKIMGSIFFVSESDSIPAELPVSFFMSGQRFILDSYILSNVVFDRIVFEGKKEKRLMPDPLDALFALGNNDALYFLQDGLETYHYASNLAQMRYLVDNKEHEFWNLSLYNAWLNSIRSLNPSEDDADYPFFMQTSAWHQQKMNTQLASWTQLRHDNLLYAKPSYTGQAGCSYPYSYIEPYPELYSSISAYCFRMADFLSGIAIDSNTKSFYSGYFNRFASIMDKLKVLSEKELRNEAFTNDEDEWLKTMLVNNPNAECGNPRYYGWLFDLELFREDFKKVDYVVVDLHTQPTDSSGYMVGNVLHTGIGAVDRGVFIIKPSGSNQYVAYTGPFMSYYETITSGFDRITDQEWAEKVNSLKLPDRPEWTNSFLADALGKSSASITELPSKFLVSVDEQMGFQSGERISFYPNPVSDAFIIRRTDGAEASISYSIFNFSGKRIFSGDCTTNQKIDFSSYPKGVYLLKVVDGSQHSAIKIMKK